MSQLPINIISATSTPTAQWSCEEWRMYYIALKGKYGKQQAQLIFLKAWNENLTWYQTWLEFSAFSLFWEDCRKDRTFINFFLQEGIDLRSVGGSIIYNIGELIIGTGDSATDIVKNTGSAIENTTGALKWVLPIAAVTIIAGGVYYLKKNADAISLK